MTALASPPPAPSVAPPAANTAPARTAPLWSSPLPIVGLTGEYSSGKTLFGLTIDPGVRTLIYDTEKSAESYRALNFNRIDVPAEMLRRHKGGSYKPLDTFLWWREHVATIPPGRFSVIVLDTASEIETGATDWVRANPSYFSRTAAQYVKMSGLLWGDMKELWKAILSDLASRCETFVFTVHMGDVWTGDKPSGKRKPRGKTTLMELASLYLQLERPKDAKGHMPAVPAAIVLKSRLAHISIDPKTGEVVTVPALPPRLPKATPAAIRQYLLTPPDYSKLAKAELAPDAEPSEDERADVRLRTAEAEAETERLRLEREERQRAANERRMGGGVTAPVPSANGPVRMAAAPAATPPIPPGDSTDRNSLPTSCPVSPELPNRQPSTMPTSIRPAQLLALAEARHELFTVLGIGEDAVKTKETWTAVLAKYGVKSAKDLSESEALTLRTNLNNKIAKLRAAANTTPATPKAPEAPPPGATF